MYTFENVCDNVENCLIIDTINGILIAYITNSSFSHIMILIEISVLHHQFRVMTNSDKYF